MIQSIDRAAKVLGLLGGARRLGITELSGALDLPPPTIHGIVKSLQAHGLVAKEPGGVRYMLGPALLKLSSVYLDSLEVRSRAMHWMHGLSEKVGLASRIGVEHFGEVLVVHHEPRPDGTAQMPETGITIPSHVSAMGKVLLAYDDDHAAEVLSRPLRSLTGATLTEPDALRGEFADIRSNEVAFENEEAIVGEVSVAAPVLGGSGQVVAALAVVAPSSGWPLEGAVVAGVRDAARSISRELGGTAWSAR